MKKRFRLPALLLSACMFPAALPAIPAQAATTEVLTGDCNADGVIDRKDAELLRSYLLGTETAISAGADLDANGRINAADLTLLKRLLLPKRETATLMVYLCGADLETDNYEATNDIAEMAAAQYTDDLNVVVFTGGTKTWHTAGLTDGGNNRILIGSSGMQIQDCLDELWYMSSGETLQTFIQDTAAEFPADHYGLVIWGHGMGSIYGLCYDPLSKRMLSLPALHSALQNAGVHFDWIGFDTCLMANAETACAVQDSADYMIASTDSVSSYGWYYTDFLTQWAAHPGTPAQVLTKQIMEDMIAVNRVQEIPATISCYDLQYTNELMDALYTYTDLNYQAYSESGIAAYLEQRAKVQDYGMGVYDMADLQSLVTMIPNAASDAVTAAMQKLMIGCLNENMESSGAAVWSFLRHPEDGIYLAASAFAPLGISETYLSQVSEMAKAAYDYLTVVEPN